MYNNLTLEAMLNINFTHYHMPVLWIDEANSKPIYLRVNVYRNIWKIFSEENHEQVDTSH